MTKKVSESSLTKRTRELIRSRPATLTLKQLATECNVSSDWLSQFVNGKIPEPGANKIQRLYERLTGCNLLGV